MSMHHKGAQLSRPAGWSTRSPPPRPRRIAVCAEPQLPVAHPPSHERPSGRYADVAGRRARRARSHDRPGAPDLDAQRSCQGARRCRRADVRRQPGAGLAVRGRRRREPTTSPSRPGERFGAAVGRRQPDSDDHEATDPGNRKEPGPNDRPSRRGGRFGTAKGSAVHAVMQQVALDDPTRRSADAGRRRLRGGGRARPSPRHRDDGPLVAERRPVRADAVARPTAVGRCTSVRSSARSPCGATSMRSSSTPTAR